MKHLGKDIKRLTEYPERFLQFGEGNFLRAFIDWMIHEMNEKADLKSRVAVVQPLQDGLIDLLNAQDGLYTLFLRGIEDGEIVNKYNIIESISRGINPYEEWNDAYLESSKDSNIRFIVSNTTEAGISYVKTEKPVDRCPDSYPAKLTAWLEFRFKTFQGTADSGLIFLPCELINENGYHLKKCILQHATDWNLGDEFKKWIHEHCFFLNTLVDRIVPGYPREEVEQLTGQLGYQDHLFCSAEVFHLLVIEGPEHLKEELPFHRAGLNVIWCDNLQRYRNRKVSILNGAHTSSVLAAYLSGLDTVRDMMEDYDLSKYVRQIVFDEIVPILDMSKGEGESYASAVIERFQNPLIRHELLTISLNSVSKWKVRVLPTIKSYIEEFDKPPRLLSSSLAILIAFYKGDLRKGYTLKDEPDVLGFFNEIWQHTDLRIIVNSTLSNQPLWGEDLTKLIGFEEQVFQSLCDLLNNGFRASICEWTQ